VFFYGAAYQKSHGAVSMLPEKGVPSAAVARVRRCGSVLHMWHVAWSLYWKRGRAVKTETAMPGW